MQKTAFLARATRLAFTAMVNSMGSSGGMTLVIIITQFSNSLKRSRLGSWDKRKGMQRGAGLRRDSNKFQTVIGHDGGDSMVSFVDRDLVITIIT